MAEFAIKPSDHDFRDVAVFTTASSPCFAITAPTVPPAARPSVDCRESPPFFPDVLGPREFSVRFTPVAYGPTEGRLLVSVGHAVGPVACGEATLRGFGVPPDRLQRFVGKAPADPDDPGAANNYHEANIWLVISSPSAHPTSRSRDDRSDWPGGFVVVRGTTKSRKATADAPLWPTEVRRARNVGSPGVLEGEPKLVPLDGATETMRPPSNDPVGQFDHADLDAMLRFLVGRKPTSPFRRWWMSLSDIDAFDRQRRIWRQGSVLDSPTTGHRFVVLSGLMATAHWTKHKQQTAHALLCPLLTDVRDIWPVSVPVGLRDSHGSTGEVSLVAWWASVRQCDIPTGWKQTGELDLGSTEKAIDALLACWGVKA